MHFPFSRPAALLCLLALTMTGVVLWLGSKSGSKAVPSRNSAPVVAKPPSPASKTASTAAVPALRAGDVDAALKRCCDMLLASNQAGQNQAALQALAAELRKMDRAAAVAAILRFLDGARDAPTGLGFAVQPGGALAASPSFRVALLDLLGELDRATAAGYADVIFQRSKVPDEWAVALRDKGRHLGAAVARKSPSYETRVLQLLTRQEWLQAPTAGFLHAFDAAVYGGGADTAGTLVDVGSMRIGAGVDFAARLALDRMALADFATTGGVLVSRLDADLPERADILARADPHSPEQTAIVNSYLSSSGVSREEKLQFIDSFPNGNLQVSANLLTTAPQLSMSILAQRDAEALRLLRHWRNDPKMSDYHAAIDARMDWLQKLVVSRGR